MASENITKVLYPNDEVAAGKELRLKQQFFFSSCSLQDMLRIHAFLGGTPATFHEKWAVQLNDTHPAVAVAELMRLLRRRALVRLGRGLEGDARHLRLHQSHSAARGAGEMERRSFRRLAAAASRDHLRDQSPLSRRSARRNFPATRRASRGCRSSMKAARARFAWRIWRRSAVTRSTASRELHSELLKQTVLRDFAELWPEKFCNVTNGVTPRRFVALSNPRLTRVDHRADRRRLAEGSESAAQAGAVRRRRGIPAAMARGEAREQTPPRRAHPGAHRHHGFARIAFRHSGEAHSRIQAPAPQRASHPHVFICA